MTPLQTNILLVDDRPENLLALEAALEPLGQRLVSATSGTEALKEILLGDFACILLDVQMPELDGFELATLIKQRERSQHIPIIFVTALSKDERNVYRGYSAGAIDYIFKPIDPDVLRSKVSVFVDLWEMSRRLQEQAEQLHEQELAARVLATIGDGVFLVDRSGRIRLWNAAAERITGIAEADVLGHEATVAIPGWDAAASRVPVAPAGEPTTLESVPLELNGREAWLSVSAVGYEEGTVYAFRDLTEEHALETMRQELVATVSHELRTPLAAIYGAALTLRREDVELEPDLRVKLLNVVIEESNRLSGIVSDLLLASQLDSGKLRVEIEQCDPREIAQLEIDSAKTHLPENIELVLTAPKKLPPVAADAGQLRQVLSNLIDNAIKYSPDGGKVTLTLARRDHVVQFAVADAGLGIPSVEQRRIFEKFYRLDPHMARGIAGTGLGLYICRELVRRVNGRLWVESDGGEGSTFFVEVPQEQVATAGGNSRQTPARAA